MFKSNKVLVYFQRVSIFLFLIIAIYLVQSKQAFAQFTETKVIASDAAAGDEFGFSVSISGDYAVVGSIADDDDGNFSGSAYIYMRSGTSWSQQAKLTASDGAAGDLFGYSVSISGDYAVVGARSGDVNGSALGSAYIYMRSGTSWSQQTKLTASDGATSDQFGWSVSISGDYAVVGASGDDDNGSLSGSAYVFKRTGTSWHRRQNCFLPMGWQVLSLDFQSPSPAITPS